MSNAPYSEGPLDCQICFVGEAPGETETKLVRPFVGPAGDLLNQMMHRAKLIRSECRLENVFQFRPDGNIITPYIKFGKKIVTESGEFEFARDQLKERLELCSANVIVPLGNVALYALTGRHDITKVRGSILESTLLPGRKVVPTIHPSAAFRMYLYQHMILSDLERVRDQAKFPEIKLLKRNLILDPTFEEACEYIRSCNNLPAVAFDIETCNNYTTHISIAKSATDCMCIPFYEQGKDIFTPEHEASIWVLLARLLANQAVVKVGQNLSYDTNILFKHLGIIARPLEDTMIANGIIYPDLPKDLGFIVSMYCNGEPYFKDEGKNWMKNPFGADIMQFRHYSAMDSAVCMEVFPQQVKELKQLGNYETYRYQVALIEPFIFMQSVGLRMDAEGLKAAHLDAEKKLGELELELTQLIGYQINPNSSDQVKEYFYETKGLPKYHKTVKTPYGKKTVVTCDEKALKQIAGKGYHEARILLEIRQLAKMKSTYYGMKLDEGRLSCAFKPVGTKYGRPSSAQTVFKTGANMQNQPPAMKKFMLADEGFILVEVDESQAENRIVAAIAGVPRMQRAFDAGVDVHRLTASSIFDKPANEISKEKGSTDIGGGKYSERDIGKKANHAFNYGLGVNLFARQIEISRRESQQLCSAYHRTYPEIQQWHNAVQEQLRRNRRLTNPYGRTYLFLNRWGDDLFKAAYAFVPQSTAADKINREGVCYIYYNQDSFEPIALLNVIHDSVVFQFPLNLGLEALRITLLKIVNNLQQPIQWQGKEIFIPADVKIGLNLGEMIEFGIEVLKSPVEFAQHVNKFYGGVREAG